MALKLRHVAYVMLYVSDMEKSLSFYHDQLGLVKGHCEANWAELQTESFTLGLHLSDKPLAQQENSPCLIFAVEDILAERHGLLDLGIQASPIHLVADQGEQVGVSTDFRDPDGNSLSLYALITKEEWERIKRA